MARFVIGRVIKPGNQVMEQNPIINILLITLRRAKKKMFLTPILFATWVKINKRGNVHKASLITNTISINQLKNILIIDWGNSHRPATNNQIDVTTGSMICSTKIKQRIKIRTWVVFIKCLSLVFIGNRNVAIKAELYSLEYKNRVTTIIHFHAIDESILALIIPCHRNCQNQKLHHHRKIQSLLHRVNRW